MNTQVLSIKFVCFKTEKSGKCKFGTTKMNSFIESELEKDNQDTISGL